MKCIVFLYRDDRLPYGDKTEFDGKTARNLCLSQLKTFSDEVVCINRNEAANIEQLLCEMDRIISQKQADYALFCYDDLPFINEGLTKKLIDSHLKYKAEYTFADGYPYGLSPEVIDAGTVKILNGLAKTNYAQQAQAFVTRQGLFEFLKNDINSFEVETVLADTDWRTLRLNFDCSCKQNYLSCRNLFNELKKHAGSGSFSVNQMEAEELSGIASKCPSVLKTVPAFYEIQIVQRAAGECIYSPYNKIMSEKGIDVLSSEKFMSFENFSKIVDSVAEFSAQAVVSLSAMGEAFCHPQILECIEKVLSYEGLSVFVETDAVTEIFNDDGFYEKLASVVQNAPERTNGWQKIMIAVNIDAASDETYRRIRQNGSSLAHAFDSIKRLENAVPGMVYPQFTRINENESELESFFRFWNDKNGPTKGNFIIQKYSDFAGLLPECKPADLSPVERNVCWHLRRDMTILLNGDVPLCRCRMFNSVTGNVFEKTLSQIWDSCNNDLLNHMECRYNGECSKCDEYYIFNF